MLSPLLAALPILLPGAPPDLQEPPARGIAGPFTWEAPAALVPRVRPLCETVEEELARIEAWLELPPSPGGRLIWVEGREAFAAAVGGPAPQWFAAVAQPGRGQVVIDVGRAQGQQQLQETLHHELVHWAMQGVGLQAWSELPAWFHEGVAETWARVDPLASFQEPLAFRAFTGNLSPLSRFNDGFGAEPVGAAEGYALGHAFVQRLVHVHGPGVLAAVLRRVAAGATLDEALIAETGLSVVSHEEALRADLGSLRALMAEMAPQLFLFVALFAAVAFPFVMRARRRRRERLEEPPPDALAPDGEDVDDRWLHLS